MSPRLKRIRKVLSPPPIKGFKPYGNESGKQQHVPINLFFEEYEALRLCDYDACNQHEASVMMCVSRPTFTRIYASALKKIAQAFVEGRQIYIEGGKVYFDSNWYQCKQCFCNFNNPEMDKSIDNCPLCGHPHIVSFNFENIEDEKQGDDICVCPDCGYEIKHQFGRPCSRQICPECNSKMKRKGTPFCKNIKKRKT